MTNPQLMSADVIVLEADGEIDDEGHGYGYPIVGRLREMGYDPYLLSFSQNAEILKILPRKPMIISGGMTEVTADINWIVESKKYLRNLIAMNMELDKKERIPLFGICFGAQLIAECWSEGNVQYLDNPEIGVSRITLSERNHRWFKEFPQQFDAYSFHYNQIKQTNLSVISSHQIEDDDFIQAFEIVDGAAGGVQFHPEFNFDEMNRLLVFYRKLIGQLGFDLNPIIQSLPKLSGNWQIIDNFLKA